MNKRRPWAESELALLRERYASSRTDEIAAALGRTLRMVYEMAAKIGIRKSAEFLASGHSGRVLHGKQNPALKATQFKAGLTPWNKGIKGVVGVQEACKSTQFKLGNKPHTWLPIGSTRVTKDGYLQRKVSDTGYVPRDWQSVHSLVWIEAYGPIPVGHIVVFKPGRKTVDPDAITAHALECVSRADLMRRNSVHTNYPPELARLVVLRGAINRQINKREKEST